MKNAVMYGAGNIGRGFIGALLSHSGYHVTFIDVVKDVIDGINTLGRYPVRSSDENGSTEMWVENISAVDGNDVDLVARTIAEGDFLCTSVGAKVLRFIAPNIARGVKLRIAEGRGPLDILICENLMDADRYIDGLLRQYLSDEEMRQVGLVETSIGRMVPVQTAEMKGDHPLRVCTERYFFLPVDRDAFKGPLPEIRNMVPYSPFHYYLERKLYLHNMGHALTAYLGDYLSKELVNQTVAVPEVRILLTGALMESAAALSKKYAVPATALYDHVTDLIYRFHNPALMDTCARVGADVPRKLAQNDRLVGGALNALSQGETPVYICVGIAAALRQHLAETAKAQTVENATAAFAEMSGLEAGHVVSECALAVYGRFAAGDGLADILRFADALKAKHNAAAV